MATAGNLITKANFSSNWCGTYTDSTSSNSYTPEWYYVAAESFVFQVKCDYDLWSSAHTIVTGYFYNGSGWSQIFHKNYVNGKDNEKLKFYHNRNAEGTNGTFNYRDSSDSQKAHLFRFRCEKNSGNSASNVTVWFGGPGMLTADEYNAYLVGKYIRSNGQLSNASDGFVYYGGKTDSPPDSTAIDRFNPRNSSGTSASASYEHHFMANWFY